MGFITIIRKNPNASERLKASDVKIGQFFTTRQYEGEHAYMRVSLSNVIKEGVNVVAGGRQYIAAMHTGMGQIHLVEAHVPVKILNGRLELILND